MEFAQHAATQDEIVAPVYADRLPLHQRIRLYLHVWSIKILVKVAMAIMRPLNIKDMGSLKPTYTKRYRVGAQLENCVWVPSSYKSGAKLPLYIDVHGGGFVIGDPMNGSVSTSIQKIEADRNSIDASFCHNYAEKHGICVVSVNYQKAPAYPFPCAVKDLIEVVQAVVEDPDLPVDKSKIAMGGFSAGGNLALAISQSPELQSKIAGLVLWYPPLDFSGKYRGPFRPWKDGSPDQLLKYSAMFDYAYLPDGQDLCDPYLSPIYAPRSKLPEKIYLLGAEYDVLCHEDLKAAEIFAQAEGATERKGDANSWTAGNISWKMIPDVKHGFHFEKFGPKDEVESFEKITEDVLAETADWLKREVYHWPIQSDC